MRFSPKVKSDLYWFTLFGVCSVIFHQIQDNFRPNYEGPNYFVKYFLGVAPNFFPAIGIPALLLIVIPELRIGKKSRWTTSYRHVTSIFISIVGLILWEVMQIFTAKGHFDWHDILWTITGSAAFYAIWFVHGHHQH